MTVIAVATPSWFTVSYLTISIEIGLNEICAEGICVTCGFHHLTLPNFPLLRYISRLLADDSMGGGGTAITKAHAALGLLCVGIMLSFIGTVTTSFISCGSCCSSRSDILAKLALICYGVAGAVLALLRF